MFFRKVLLLICLFALIGCVPRYFVSNELSDLYYNDRNFFSDQYSKLKSENILFYIKIGYYDKETSELIIFLYHNTIVPGEILLTHTQLLSNNNLVNEILDVNNLFTKRQEEIRGVTYFQGGARLAFGLQNIRKILRTDLILRVYFQTSSGTQNSIDLEMDIAKKWVWPT